MPKGFGRTKSATRMTRQKHREPSLKFGPRLKKKGKK